MFLADTTFLVDLARERRRGVTGPCERWLASHRAEICTTFINVAEAETWYSDLAAASRFLGQFRVLPFKRQIVHVASRLDRQQKAAGKRLGENDTWIAAHALFFGCTVLGRDTGFTHVRGLRFQAV